LPEKEHHRPGKQATVAGPASIHEPEEPQNRVNDCKLNSQKGYETQSNDPPINPAVYRFHSKPSIAGAVPRQERLQNENTPKVVLHPSIHWK
jgi:hypothetical protein